MDYFQAVAIRNGYSLAEYERLELDDILTAYKVERRRDELLERSAWERARIGWFYTIRGYSKVRNTKAIMVFPWETEQRVITPEKKKELDKMYHDKRFPSTV